MKFLYERIKIYGKKSFMIIGKDFTDDKMDFTNDTYLLFHAR